MVVSNLKNSITLPCIEIFKFYAKLLNITFYTLYVLKYLTFTSTVILDLKSFLDYINKR